MKSRPGKISRKLARSRAKRRAAFARARLRMLQSSRVLKKKARKPEKTEVPRAQGYDPEMLYVECGRCGAPVLWDEGRATKLLDQAGIDPLELDPSCMLVTDACPACGSGGEYGVRIFRITERSAFGMPPSYGNA